MVVLVLVSKGEDWSTVWKSAGLQQGGNRPGHGEGSQGDGGTRAWLLRMLVVNLRLDEERSFGVVGEPGLAWC